MIMMLMYIYIWTRRKSIAGASRRSLRVRCKSDLHVAVVENGKVDLEEDVAVDLWSITTVGLDTSDAH